MQDFVNYNYTIKIQDLEKTAKRVIESGYSFLVVINGEYYDIQIQDEKERQAGNGHNK